MRAVGIVEHGGPEKLVLLDLPAPDLAPEHVRIQVRASAVNPTDTLARSGARAERQRPYGPPWVPGMDVAGIVVEVGRDCKSSVAVGDDVIAMLIPRGAHGAYAENVVVHEHSVAPLPGGASYVEAATLPMNGLTAVQALRLLGLLTADSVTGDASGATIAVTGAAGAFGGYVMQLAAHSGATVIGDAAPADRALVSSLGADHVVERGQDVAELLRGIIPAGVDVLADGALQGEAIAPAVRDNGRIATLRRYVGGTDRGLSWHPVGVDRMDRDHGALTGLAELATAGILTLRVADAIPAEHAADAHRRLEAGGVRGRLVLTW